MRQGKGMRTGKILAAAGVICFLAANIAHAASAGSMAKKAGRFYREEKYDEALENYDQALSIKPDDPIIQYNRAVTLYRKDRFSDAEEAFLSSLAAGKEDIEERTVYNTGNSKYRIGEESEAGDPSSALQSYREAVQYYKRAMELAPDDSDAKYNYEYTLKKIDDLESKAQQPPPPQQQPPPPQQQKQQQQKQQQKQQQEQKEKEKQEQEEQEQQQKQQQQQEQKEKDKQEQEQQQQEQREQEKKEEERKRQQEQKRREEQEKDREQQEPRPERFEEKRPEASEGQSPEPLEPEPAEGEMTREEAEMLIRRQSEEESRMRAEQKEARKAGHPRVLRDW